MDHANGFTLNADGMLAQLAPRLTRLMRSQSCAFALIVLPEYQLLGGKVHYITNIQKDQLVALLKEQIVKLEAM